MAYMTRDGKGPYPNKAGEYCGNHHPTHLRYAGGAQEAYLNRMRFGRPRSCEAGTKEQMTAERLRRPIFKRRFNIAIIRR